MAAIQRVRAEGGGNGGREPAVAGDEPHDIYNVLNWIFSGQSCSIGRGRGIPCICSRYSGNLSIEFGKTVKFAPGVRIVFLVRERITLPHKYSTSCGPHDRSSVSHVNHDASRSVR